MTLLSFPDVNVWFALLIVDHNHHKMARTWWTEDQSDFIVFSRFTQLSVLRLLTTAATMRGNPLSMREAWRIYDRLFEDDRVMLRAEPEQFEPELRRLSSSEVASPKVWADASLVAFAARIKAKLVTFDRALEKHGVDCLILG